MKIILLIFASLIVCCLNSCDCSDDAGQANVSRATNNDVDQGDVPKNIVDQCNVLLEATENNDLEKFKSVCNAKMKKAITKEKLTRISKKMSVLMKQGYHKKYFGLVDRLAMKTYYWKIKFKTKGTPEVLVQMTSDGEKASGFYIH